MYKNLLICLIIFLAVMLQVSFFTNLIPFGVFPDIALIIILFWSMRLGFDETWKWAILAGVMVDLAYFRPVGASIFAFVFCAYVVNSLAKRFLVTQTAFQFLVLSALIISGTILNSLLVVLAVKFSRREAIDLNLLFFNWDILLKTFYNLIIFSLIYVPLRKLEKFSASLDARLKSLG